MANQEQSFDGNSNYQKVQRFGDEALRGTLEGYTAHIKQRNEENRLNGLYTTARQRMDAALSEVDYKRAAEAFAMIPNYRDADKLRDTCLERAENVIYTSAQQRMSIAKNRADYERAAELFSRILTYRNAGELHQQCLESAEVCRKDTIYNTADTIVQETPNSFNNGLETGIAHLCAILLIVKRAGAGNSLRRLSAIYSPDRLAKHLTQ